MKNHLYPIKFSPLFKEKIWGGRNIEKIFDRKLPTDQKIGESWEICDREEDQTLVENGELKGKTLQELMETLKTDLMGNYFKKMPKRFPLLFKIIDAQDDLSLQVHPNDTYAQSNEKDLGKTEMWYVVYASQDAKIFCGLKKGIDPNLFQKALSSDEVISYLQVFNPKAGDVFFVPAGTVHALGKGNVVIEIQQNSDVTYRLSDWGRLGDNGQSRPLHITQGMEVIAWGNKNNKISPTDQNKPLVSCSYFTVYKNNYRETKIEQIESDSFQVWIILEGSGKLNDESVQKGDFILIPAKIGEVEIEPHKPIHLLKVLTGQL